MKRMVFKQLSSTLYTSITKNPPKICFFLQRRGLGMKRMVFKRLLSILVLLRIGRHKKSCFMMIDKIGF